MSVSVIRSDFASPAGSFAATAWSVRRTVWSVARRVSMVTLSCDKDSPFPGSCGAGCCFLCCWSCACRSQSSSSCSCIACMRSIFVFSCCCRLWRRCVGVRSSSVEAMGSCCAACRYDLPGTVVCVSVGVGPPGWLYFFFCCLCTPPGITRGADWSVLLITSRFVGEGGEPVTKMILRLMAVARAGQDESTAA